MNTHDYNKKFKSFIDNYFKHYHKLLTVLDEK